MTIKRLIASALSIFVLVSISFLFVLPASADNYESWIIVDYRTSPDGTNWSSRKEIQLIDGAFAFDPSQRYIKIDRIRFLDTTNKPSDVFISFSVNIHPYVFSNVTSTSTFDGTANHEWSGSSYTGYFRSRSNQYYVPAPADFLGTGYGILCVGSFALPNTTASVNFNLTPDSDVYRGFTYTGSGNGVAISISNVNVIFLEESTLYDIHHNITSVHQTLINFYNTWNSYFNNFLDYVEFVEETIYPFFEGWYTEWNQNFYPKFVNIWTYLTQSNYSYQAFQGHGAGISSLTTKNPFQAINNGVSVLVRYFNKIQQNQYSYDSISYDSNGIGTVTVVNNVPWFDAVLGQLQGQSAIDQHHMEHENEVLEAGASDAYDDFLSFSGTGFGSLRFFGVLNNWSSLWNRDSTNSNVASIYDNWYSQNNKDNIEGVQSKGSDDEIIDFLTPNQEYIRGVIYGD